MTSQKMTHSKTDPLIKFSSCLPASTAKALRRFAADQGYPVYQIIAAALKKCLPPEFFD